MSDTSTYDDSDSGSTGFTHVVTSTDITGKLSVTDSGINRYSLLDDYASAGDNDTDVNHGLFASSVIGMPVMEVPETPGPTGSTQVAGDIQHKYCFAAGTLVVMADGSRRAIESLKAGDQVLAVHEGKPDGKPQVCRVEEVFRNEPQQIWEVYLLGGQVIRTTAGHVVYAKGKGWVQVHELEPGDCFRTQQGEGLRVEAVMQASALEPVYNLRVQDCHTYFVAAEKDGPAMLVHNDSGYWTSTGTSGQPGIFYYMNGSAYELTSQHVTNENPPPPDHGAFVHKNQFSYH